MKYSFYFTKISRWHFEASSLKAFVSGAVPSASRTRPLVPNLTFIGASCKLMQPLRQLEVGVLEAVCLRYVTLDLQFEELSNILGVGILQSRSWTWKYPGMRELPGIVAYINISVLFHSHILLIEIESRLQRRRLPDHDLQGVLLLGAAGQLFQQPLRALVRAAGALRLLLLQVVPLSAYSSFITGIEEIFHRFRQNIADSHCCHINILD